MKRLQILYHRILDNLELRYISYILLEIIYVYKILSRINIYFIYILIYLMYNYTDEILR